MKKRFCTLLLALIVLASLVTGALPSLAADGDITLRLHYFREDGNYDGWELWVWDYGPAQCTYFDAPYQFEKIDGEMICEIKVNPGTVKIGYFVRRELIPHMCIEPREDQFINIEGIIAGTVDVYVRDGVEGYEIVLGDDVLMGPVILNAYYKEKNAEGNPQVIVKMSSVLDIEPTLDTITVSNSDGTVAVSAVKNINNYYYLTLIEPLILQHSYIVTFKDKECTVLMPEPKSDPETETEPTTILIEEGEGGANIETTSAPSQEVDPETVDPPHHSAKLRRMQSSAGMLPWIILAVFGTVSMVTVSVLILKKKR